MQSASDYSKQFQAVACTCSRGGRETEMIVIYVLLAAVGLGIGWLGVSDHVVKRFEPGVVVRFGRVRPEIRRPGLPAFIVPFADRLQKVDMSRPDAGAGAGWHHPRQRAGPGSCVRSLFQDIATCFALRTPPNQWSGVMLFLPLSAAAARPGATSERLGTRGHFNRRRKDHVPALWPVGRCV